METHLPGGRHREALEWAMTTGLMVIKMLLERVHGFHNTPDARVLNGRRKTGLDWLVQSKVKSTIMVEIRPTRWWGLFQPTRPGLV